MNKLLTALLAGGALALGGTATLAAEQGNAHRNETQSQTQPEASQAAGQGSAQSGQGAGAGQSTGAADENLIVDMKCNTLSGKQKQDCMAKARSKLQANQKQNQPGQAARDESGAANSRHSAGTNAGATDNQSAKAAQEQNLIVQMKCESLSGKQRQDCITKAKQKAGEM